MPPFRFLPTICCCALAFVVSAQKNPSLTAKEETLNFSDTARLREKGLELGLVASGLYYYGDLSDDDYFAAKDLTWSYGVFMRKRLYHFLSLRGSVTLGKLSGYDIAYPDRNYRFNTALREVSLRAEYEFLSRYRFRRQDTVHYRLNKYTQIAEYNRLSRIPSPYIALGFGTVNAKPEISFNKDYAEDGGFLGKLAEDQEAASELRNNFSLHLGAGAQVDLGYNWTFGAEAGFNTAFTDYLDGFSKAAGGDKMDLYWNISAMLGYRIGSKDRDGDGVADAHDKCPKIPGPSMGCPDADGDGVADIQDACPQRKGVVALEGCPQKDTDNDEVPDASDLCPTVAGKPEFGGCNTEPTEKMLEAAGDRYVPFVKKESYLSFVDSSHIRERGPELGVLLNGFFYKGDLTSSVIPSPQDMTLGFGVFVRKRVFPFLAFRTHLMLGKLSSPDRAYPDRDYAFNTTISELGLRAEYEIFGKKRFRSVETVQYRFDNYTQIARRKRLNKMPSPFLTAGVGFLRLNPEIGYDQQYAEQSNLLDRLASDKKAVQKPVQTWNMYAGGGFHMDLNADWAMSAELGINGGFSDYFDGFSIAGNPAENDLFWNVGLTVSKRLGKKDRDADGVADKKDKCPDTPGPVKGCPDADGDRIADYEDDCPHKPGLDWLMGCPMKDMDKDSVQDIDDECPTVPGLAALKGCPDTDKDGVADYKDSCMTVAGLAAFNGCPDTDGDGVEDKLDLCPAVAGSSVFKGCPDTDGDGVEDKLDLCPTEAGLLAYDGCAWRDKDNDGIEDLLDRCPAIAGLKEFSGCPDTDKDGVEDPSDVCPTTPGDPLNKGCPVIAKKDQEKLEFAVKAVKFETGKAILKSESNKILNEIAEIMLRYPDYQLRIEGHTDDQGSDQTNQTLSEKRAKACIDYLLKKKVPQARMKSAGFGESKPVADNKTTEGRAQNRRVEFILDLPNNG